MEHNKMYYLEILKTICINFTKTLGKIMIDTKENVLYGSTWIGVRNKNPKPYCESGYWSPMESREGFVI